MKTVFVVGFFDPVKKALENTCPEYLQNQSVVWIRQVAPRRQNGSWKPGAANFNEFSGRFFERISAGSDPILVLLVVPDDHTWVVQSAEAIIERATNEFGVQCHLKTFQHASDQSGVLDAISEFKLQAPPQLSYGKVAEKIGGRRVLCVSMEGRTSILDSLKRAGFPEETISACFDETRILGGKNSNLMEYLISSSKKYGCLLYAWDGLRTSTADVKGSFGKCYEAPTAAKVVHLFKRWILEGV